MTAVPAPHPCASCPYRRDVPSGVWEEHEYDKLPPYDADTPFQPPAAFFCHQDNGKLCAGWVGCHDMRNSLGLRFAVSTGLISPDDYEACLDYASPVELFESGKAAAAHGTAEIVAPGAEAQRTITKLQRRRARRGSSRA